MQIAEDPYQIKIPLFEGPLDLLLHLIKENKIDIYDIPIAVITRQYLEYIEMMKELNLEIAGDFIVMAATLIHIKSRMLLPIEETADTDEPEDPRLELVLKLLEYKSFKEAAYGLKEKEEEWSEVYQRAPMDEEEAPAEGEGEELELFDMNLFDLLSAFKEMLQRGPAEIRQITREALNIKDKMSVIIETLKAHEAVRFQSLFKGDVTLAHFLVTFIALLELIKLGLAKAYQQKSFGSIWIINPEAEVTEEKLASLHASDEGADQMKISQSTIDRKKFGINFRVMKQTASDESEAETATLSKHTPSMVELPYCRLDGPEHAAACFENLWRSANRALPYSGRKNLPGK